MLEVNAANTRHVATLGPAELRRLLNLGGIHLVAIESEREVVAYVLAFAHVDAYDGEEYRYFKARIVEPFLYIDQIAVSSTRRRHGIGRMLYRYLAVHAKEQGILRLCCEVNIDPPNAISLEFHQGLGFAQLGTLNVEGRAVALLTLSLA